MENTELGEQETEKSDYTSCNDNVKQCHLKL